MNGKGWKRLRQAVSGQEPRISGNTASLRRLLFVEILVIQDSYPDFGQSRQQFMMNEPRNKAALLMQLNSAGPQFLFHTQPAAEGLAFLSCA